MILSMNDFYFNHHEYSEIFSFFKKLKKNMKNRFSNKENDLMKKYFDLFLDSYSAWSSLKLGKEKFIKFYISSFRVLS